jgi:hypothetical protein
MYEVQFTKKHCNSLTPESPLYLQEFTFEYENEPIGYAVIVNRPVTSLNGLLHKYWPANLPGNVKYTPLKLLLVALKLIQACQ